MMQMTLADAYTIGFKDGVLFHAVPSDEELKAEAKKNWDSFFFEGHVESKEEGHGNGKLQAEQP